MTRYRTIVADPPWQYDRGFATNPKPGDNTRTLDLPYPSMSVDEICALPVSALADAHARLFLWTTTKYLPDAFRVVGAWGFEYRQIIVWHKTGNPSPFGGITPNHAEFLLIAARGTPGLLERLKSNVVPAPVQGHSVKPEVFLDLVEQVSPGPYLELFARRRRLGWDAWGNEVDSSIVI